MDQENQIDMESINNFKMPKANPGLTVLWYPMGKRDRTRVEVAYMIRPGERTASMFAPMSGRRLEGVRHVDDPKLDLSPEQRESGAWDFTDDWRSQAEFRASLEERLLRIERILSESDEDAKKPASVVRRQGNPQASAALAEFRALRKQAIDLGLPIGPSIRKDELKALVLAHTPNAVV